jgi:hypothetical protein
VTPRFVPTGFWGRITISLWSEAQHPLGGPQARGICALTPKTPDPEFVFLIERARTSQGSDAAQSPRPATYISLSRQRNLGKRKATLVPASLRCATGNLRCSVQPGSRSNSPAAQTIAVPDPSEPPLIGAFTRVWGAGSGSDSGQFIIAYCYYFHSCLRTYYFG